MYIYKIYFSTDVDYKQTNKLISELETLFLNNSINLDGFTIIKTEGYYKGEIETSYIFKYIDNMSSDYEIFRDDKICIMNDTDNIIKRLSKLIKSYFQQKEVLTIKQKIDIL